MGKNKSLTDEELAKFLNTIEDEDADYEESMEDSIRRIQYEEMVKGDMLPEEMMTDKAWHDQVKAVRDENGEYVKDETGRVKFQMVQYTHTYMQERWEKCMQKSKETRKNKALEIKRRKIEIQKEALNSDFLKMHDEVTVQHKKLLISLLTAEYKRMMDKSYSHINKRITKLLGYYIPVALKSCYGRFKESFISNPGFMYLASKEYGCEKRIWVYPKLPYYFTQGTEMQVLLENESQHMYSIDKAVVQYCENRDTLQKREIYYAVRLRSVNTYYKLVQKNPFWYDLLVQELRKCADNDAENQ